MFGLFRNKKKKLTEEKIANLVLNVPIKIALDNIFREMDENNIKTDFTEVIFPLLELKTKDGNFQVRLSVSDSTRFVDSRKFRKYNMENNTVVVQDILRSPFKKTLP